MFRACDRTQAGQGALRDPWGVCSSAAPSSGPPEAAKVELTSTQEMRTPHHADMELAVLVRL